MLFSLFNATQILSILISENLTVVFIVLIGTGFLNEAALSLFIVEHILNHVNFEKLLTII